MAITELLRQLKSDKKRFAAIIILGAAGLLLIMLSSFFPDEEKSEDSKAEKNMSAVSSEDYCHETEQKLTEFLENIEGVGKAEVYLTVKGEETYVYATEGKTSVSENKREEEHKYVMIGSSSDKTALVETVCPPQISGAVIACTGCDNPAVQEKVYKAVSAALGIPTAWIYVTKLK